MAHKITSNFAKSGRNPTGKKEGGLSLLRERGTVSCPGRESKNNIHPETQRRLKGREKGEKTHLLKKLLAIGSGQKRKTVVDVNIGWMMRKHEKTKDPKAERSKTYKRKGGGELILKDLVHNGGLAKIGKKRVGRRGVEANQVHEKSFPSGLTRVGVSTLTSRRRSKRRKRGEKAWWGGLNSSTPRQFKLLTIFGNG